MAGTGAPQLMAAVDGASPLETAITTNLSDTVARLADDAMNDTNLRMAHDFLCRQCSATAEFNSESANQRWQILQIQPGIFWDSTEEDGFTRNKNLKTKIIIIIAAC